MLIIADVGPNHGGYVEVAKRMVQSVKDCGADIVKFQLYDVDRICKPESEFYGELKKAQLSREQWTQIVDECNRVGIEFLASVFDVERIAWCEWVGMRRYKIASRSIYDKELIDAVIRTGKPIIASLGLYHEPEFPSFKADYLYCASKYPATPEDLKLSNVDFNKYSGFSDHSPGVEASIASIVRGARIVEKHFTPIYRQNDPCNSATPSELAQIVDFAHKWERMR